MYFSNNKNGVLISSDVSQNIKQAKKKNVLNVKDNNSNNVFFSFENALYIERINKI